MKNLKEKIIKIKDDDSRIRKNYTINKKVASDFEQVCKKLELNYSRVVEYLIRLFIMDNP